MAVVIGIDGGVSGAIAFLYDDRPPVVLDLPTVPNEEGGAIKRRVHGPSLSALLTEQCTGQAGVRAYIEAISSGGMGRGNAMSVGSQFDSFATVRCVMEMRRLGLKSVTPARWKSMYGLVNKRGAPKEQQLGKADSLARARDLFPEMAQTELRLASHHNRAEALLIANFARKALA